MDVKKQNILMFRLIALLVTSFLFTSISIAQVAKTSKLHLTLKAKDSLFFEEGFNKCDLDIIEKLTSEDFEFYHDIGGTDTTKASFMASIKDGLCQSGTNTTRRELVENSLEVYPLHNKNILYGAIQRGIHRFFDTEAKFTHLWLLENGEWKISRVLSYDHQDGSTESTDVTEDDAIIEALEKEEKRIMTNEEVEKLIGDYGDLNFKFENNTLIQTWEGNEYPMVNVEMDIFKVEGYPGYTLQFLRGKNNVVTGCRTVNAGDPALTYLKKSNSPTSNSTQTDKQPLKKSIPQKYIYPSRSEGGESTITFINELKKEVFINWIFYDGESRFYKKLKPGEQFKQPTYPGHYWLVTDNKKNGKAIVGFRATQENATAIITNMPKPIDLRIPTLTTTQTKAIIKKIQQLMLENYIFLDKAELVNKHLDQLMSEKYFDSYTKPHDLAMAITDEMREITKDKHLGVREPRQGSSESNDQVSLFSNLPRNQAPMFKEFKTLENNIGYIDMRYFGGEQTHLDKIDGVMKFLTNSDAFIIDMRNNGGGSISAVNYLSSYFFKEHFLLNTIYTRANDHTEELMTADVKGKKLPKVPVYILTSDYTFSGAEDFSYTMQNHGNRATIIGEVTGGGAHPTRQIPLLDGFRIAVPYARTINPITKTNWEGVGVIPDVKISADKALEKAKEMATIGALKYKNSILTPLETALNELESKIPSKEDESNILKLLEEAVQINMLSENDINILGYNYLRTNKINAATVILKSNTLSFPNSSNVYDSYGEALLLQGNKEQAIENYKKSVKLDSNNYNGIMVIKRLETSSEMKVSVKELKLLEGEYIVTNHPSNKNWKIVFNEVKGELICNDNGYKYTLASIGNNKFVNPDDGASIEFNTKDKNAITMMLFGKYNFKKAK